MVAATTKSQVNMAASSSAAVANEFITLSLSDPTYSIDQMKLQKLLFYAHGWHLAYQSKPLFEEDFEAWPWGPVVRDVYYQTRDYGRGQVTDKITVITRTGAGFLDFKMVAPDGVSPDLKPFIHSVWEAYKNYSGIQLSNATHVPGEPWAIVKEQYGGNLKHKPTIPNDLIASVFKKKLENAAAKNPTAG